MADYSVLSDPTTAKLVCEGARRAVDDGGNNGIKNVSQWAETAPVMSRADRVELAKSMFEASWQE